MRMRETFKQVYQAKTRTDFGQLLSKWDNWVSQCNLPAVVETSKTIKNHWQGIVQWKLSSINNGILEGLNSIIQVAKRKARSYGKKTFKDYCLFADWQVFLHKINVNRPTCF